MVERWTDGDITKFLEVYQEKEILWNPKLELYRNNAARIAALDEIIHSLQKPNLTPNDLKIKIKNIRTIYNRELSKLLKSKKSGAGANDIYKPALRWFEQADTFLRAVTEARPSKSNLVSINLVFKMMSVLFLSYFIDHNILVFIPNLENSTIMSFLRIIIKISSNYTKHFYCLKSINFFVFIQLPIFLLKCI